MKIRLNASKPKAHRPGSNVVAAAAGLALLAFAAFIWLTGTNPLESIRYETIVAATSLTFGAVLLLWVASDWKEWIGNETVNMVVGVLAAVVAIAAFAQDIGRGGGDRSCRGADAPATRSAPASA